MSEKIVDILIASLVIILMLSLYSFGFRIANKKKIKKALDYNFHHLAGSELKRHPVTNREYILYLNWQVSTYGDSYPEKIMSALPLDRNIKLSTLGFDYQAIINSVEDSIFQQYTLNPKYLDYPLIGLSKKQIFEIIGWLSDRYNENILLDRGFLNFNPEQRDVDCFVLSSYLSDQYEGSVRKNLPDERTGGERAPMWKDVDFIPTFRLPIESEFQQIELQIEDPNKLKEFKFDKKHFLWKWNEYYLNPKAKDPSALYPISKFTIHEGNLDIDQLKLEKGIIDQKPYQQINYFDNLEIAEKDKYGQMKFEIIGENDSGKVVVGVLMELEDSATNMVSWVLYENPINFELEQEQKL